VVPITSVILSFPLLTYWPAIYLFILLLEFSCKNNLINYFFDPWVWNFFCQLFNQLWFVNLCRTRGTWWGRCIFSSICFWSYATKWQWGI
jgi:hypothetical protein